jgi:hypothetical protein
VAGRLQKHAHEWYPVARKIGTDDGTAYDFVPGSYAKPRGFKPPEDGDAILWTCGYRATVKIDDKGGRPTYRVMHCIETLNYVEAFRLRNKGEFTEVEPPGGIT